MKEDYYSKGTTKKKELIKVYLKTKHQTSFSHQDLESLV